MDEDSSYHERVEKKILVYEESVRGLVYYEHSTNASERLFYDFVNEILVDKKTGKEVVAEVTFSTSRTKNGFSSQDCKLKLSRLKNPLELFRLLQRVEDYQYNKLPKLFWKRIDEKFEKLSNHLYYKQERYGRRGSDSPRYVFFYEKDGIVQGVELNYHKSYINIHESSYGPPPTTLADRIQRGIPMNDESKDMALFLLKISKESWRASNFIRNFHAKVQIAFQAAMFLKYRNELKEKKVVVCSLPSGQHVRMINNEAVVGKHYIEYGMSAFEFEVVNAECLLNKLEE